MQVKLSLPSEVASSLLYWMLCFSWPGKPSFFIFLFKRFAQQQIKFSIRGIRRDDQKCKLLEGQIYQQKIQFCYIFLLSLGNSIHPVHDTFFCQ